MFHPQAPAISYIIIGHEQQHQTKHTCGSIGKICYKKVGKGKIPLIQHWDFSV